MKPSHFSRVATRLTRILAAGATIALALPSLDANAAECVVPLPGKWQQTHTLIQGNKIPDDTQSWVFNGNGTMQFSKTKPPLNISGKYKCDGYIIQIIGRMSNSFKIVDHGLDTMTLESSLGGTVFVKRLPK